MTEKMMFPTDFSNVSNNMYKCIPSFIPLGLKEVLLVHIVDERNDQNILERTEMAKTALEAHKDQLKNKDIVVKTIVRTGVPFIELNNIANEEDVSLVVITSHGKSLVEKMLLGSVAEKFIFHSNRPVLIEKVKIFEEVCTHEECTDKICKATFNHVLFPTDWSECAKDVLNKLKGFKEYGTNEITVLHVMDDRNLKYITKESRLKFEGEDLEKLKIVKEELTEAGFSVKTKLTHGIPFKEIKRAARESEVTLIVMGIHGKGFVKEMMIGSTAEKIAKLAFKPILLLCHKKG